MIGSFPVAVTAQFAVQNESLLLLVACFWD